jgi:hypothetical protein
MRYCIAAGAFGAPISERPWGVGINRAVFTLRREGYAAWSGSTHWPAAEMGISSENAVAYIEISPDVSGLSHDRLAILKSQAVTVGPMFSAAINAAVVEAPDPTSMSVQEITRVVAASVDPDEVEKWLHSRALIAIFGPLAEAAATGKTFDEVWSDYAAENDMRSLIQDCMIGGQVDRVGEIVEAAVHRGGSLLQDGRVIEALNSLAAAMPRKGKMSGVSVAAIIGKHLGGDVAGRLGLPPPDGGDTARPR